MCSLSYAIVSFRATRDIGRRKDRLSGLFVDQIPHWPIEKEGIAKSSFPNLFKTFISDKSINGEQCVSHPPLGNLVGKKNLVQGDKKVEGLFWHQHSVLGNNFDTFLGRVVWGDWAI